MHKYILKEREELSEELKQKLKKEIIKVSLIVGLPIIAMWAVWISLYLSMEEISNFWIGLIIILIVTLVQAVIFIKNIKEIIEKYTASVNRELEIEFNENGITIESVGISRSISWEAVKEVQVYETFFIIYSSVNGFFIGSLMFSRFNSSKEDILNNIQKYKELKGWG